MQRGHEELSVRLCGDVHDTPITVYRECAEGSGRALLLVHGFGDNSHTWQGLRNALRGAGTRPLSLDLPGFGRSPLHESFAVDYLWNCGALLRAAANRWSPDEEVVGIGNSLGGSALLCALGLERDAQDARRFAAAELLSPATLDTRMPPFLRLLQLPTYQWMNLLSRRLSRTRWRSGMELVARVSMRFALAPRARVDPAWFESIVEGLSRPDALRDLEAIGRDLVRALRGRSPALSELDEAPPTEVPVLVLRGALDRVISERELRDLTERLPRGRFVSLPGVGHCPQLEAPDEVARRLVELTDSL